MHHPHKKTIWFYFQLGFVSACNFELWPDKSCSLENTSDKILSIFLVITNLDKDLIRQLAKVCSVYTAAIVKNNSEWGHMQLVDLYTWITRK